MGFNILFIGEIIGKAGVFTVKESLSKLRGKYDVDFVIASGNWASSGGGIGKSHASYLKKLGLDVITTGEGAFFKKDIIELHEKKSWLIRPANYPQDVPGRGWNIYRHEKMRIAVLVLLGQAGFKRVHLDNPFHALDRIYDEIKDKADIVFLEFRASSTAEKVAMAHYADGRLTAIVGSYARAITSDASIGPGGTAFICDAGRTGSMDSVGGMEPQGRIQSYLSGVHNWVAEAGGRTELQGSIIECDDDGRAIGIKALRFPCSEVFK